jgi:hypothetical protein
MFTLRRGEAGLSVFELDSDTQPTIDRVTTAVALTRQRVRPIGYRVVSSSAIAALNLTIITTKGATPDSVANDLHREFANITDIQSRQLAFYFGKHGRGQQYDVAELMRIIKRGFNAVHFKIKDIIGDRLREEIKTITMEEIA